MKTNKTTLSFTAEELQLIQAALNEKALDYMDKSKTWGDIEAKRLLGYDDYYSKQASLAIDLQTRFWAAENRLAARSAEDIAKAVLGF